MLNIGRDPGYHIHRPGIPSRHPMHRELQVLRSWPTRRRNCWGTKGKDEIAERSAINDNQVSAICPVCKDEELWEEKEKSTV